MRYKKNQIKKKENLNKNLYFTTDLSKALEDSTLIFLALVFNKLIIILYEKIK